MSKLGLAGSALLATAGGATTLASGLTITAHASEKPQTNTQQTNQADKLKKASNQLDTASKQQAKMINALLESKVDAQVPTQPGTYTKSVALLDASGKQLGTATLTRVVNADGSTQSSLSKDIPAGYTLKDVNVLNHYPSAVTLTRVADATPAGTTTKAIKLTDANGKLIANGTVTRVVDEKGASTVSVKGIPQGYKVASMKVLKTFPDQLVIEKGEAINSNTAENTDAGTMNNVPAGGTTADSRKILDSGGVTKTAGQGNATAGNQSGTTTNTGADKGNTTAGQGNQQTGNTASGTTTGNTGSQSGQAQQGGTTTDNGTSATDSTTNAQGVPVSDAVKYDLAHHIIINYGGAITPPEEPVEKPATTVNTANATNSNQANTTDSNTNTGADANKGQQTSDASKDSSKTSTDSKTTTDQGKTDTKKDDSKTPTSTTDSAKKDDTKKDDSRASTSKNTSASTDEKKDEAKKGDSKSDTSKTNASKTTDNSKTNDTNSKVDNAIKSIDSVAKGSTDATKSADSKSSDTDKKDDSKKSNSSKSDNKKSDDKKSDKKDGKLDLSDTTDALKKSSKDDDKKDSNSDNSSKKDNVSNLLNKSANKSSKASDNAKVADANVSDNLSGKDNSTKEGTTSSSTNTTLPETGNTQSTAGILAGSAMVATMTALGIGATRRKRV